MHSTEASQLAGTLKGLFPMMTPEQLVAAGKALAQRDDPEACRAAIYAYSHDYDQFGVASFIDRLPPRPGDGGMSEHDSRVRQSIDEGNAIERQHEADNDVCERLDDATFDATAKAIIGNMDADIAAMLLKRKTHRQSQWIRSLVAEYARVNGLVQVLEGVR